MNAAVDGGVVANFDRSVHAPASEIDARIHFALDTFQHHRSLVIETPRRNLATKLVLRPLTRFDGPKTSRAVRRRDRATTGQPRARKSPCYAGCMNNLGDLSDDRLLEDLGRLRGTGLRPRAHRTEDGLSIRLRAAERTPVEASTNDTELAATYTKIERLLTQQGYRAKQAAWAIVRLRARHTADLSRPTTVELVREAFLLLAPGSSAAR